MIVTGAVPEQQFSTLIPWMMEKYGKKVYTIAADYNFGQISAEWVRNDRQGEGRRDGRRGVHPARRVAIRQTIQNIQKAKPDVLVTLLVGASQASYLRAGGRPPTSTFRWAARSTSVRPTSTSASSRRASPGHVRDDELRSRKSIAGEQGLRRQVASRRSRRSSPTSTRRPRTPIDAIYLYKADGREGEGSTDQAKIKAALGSGDVCIDAPDGKVCIDPKSQHMSATRST